MLTWTQKKIEIVECDNGYVVEWQDESRAKGRWPGNPEADLQRPTRGVKIFANKTDLVKYVTEFYK